MGPDQERELEQTPPVEIYPEPLEEAAEPPKSWDAGAHDDQDVLTDGVVIEL